MDKLNKALKLNFFFALVFSVMLPVGIVGIVFGAVNDSTLLLVCGIVCTVLGFYITPLMWVRYGNLAGLKPFLQCVTQDNLYTVSQLSQQLNTDSANTINKINTLIRKGYLSGYLFVNKQELVLNSNTKQQRQTVVKYGKCPNCGAPVISPDKCEYCGALFQIEK